MIKERLNKIMTIDEESKIVLVIFVAIFENWMNCILLKGKVEMGFCCAIKKEFRKKQI